MRKVNQRSRRLRHLNSGTKRESYFSQIKSLLSFFSRSKSPSNFSIEHQDNRYDEYGLAYSKPDRKNIFGYANLKKYLTHIGIVAVCGFTIFSNTCFGDSNYTQTMTAMASSNKNSDLVEIDANSDSSASQLVTDSQINQVASTINTYNKADSKKAQIDQAIKQNEDSDSQDMAIIQDAYLDKTNSPITQGSSDITRKHVITHLVKEDETLWSIADKYGLSTDTIKWSNGMDDSGTVIPGQGLYILPMDGIYYTVQDGDTLSSISEKYKSDQSEIEKWNDFSSEGLSLGRKIILPGGTVPPPPKPVVTAPTTDNSSSSYSNSYYSPEPDYGASSAGGSGQFSWPTSGIFISQYFGATDFNPWHTGIDLDSRSGWDIFASDGGTVVLAEWGWGGGYGNHIIIDHGNGYQTLYGHLSNLDVSVGQTVSKGQRIGTMGSTGWSTGPHLHFEIRYNGTFLNPLNFLS